MSSKNKQNVLFIAIDDLRPQLNCYGYDSIISPNMDALAKSGILFENAYCQQAVCAPSRCNVLSGCRPDTTKVYDLQTPLKESMPDVLTLPQHFKNNGYETISIGKIYHHENEDPKGWSKEPYHATGDWQGRGYLTDEAMEQAMKDKSGRGVGHAYESADVKDDDYQDGKNLCKAVEELNRLKNSDKPFFLAFGLHKPHLPFNAPKKYWDMYKAEEIQLANNNFAPENVTPYSIPNYGELRQYFDIPNSEAIDDDLALKLIHGYCACITYIDTLIGRLLEELERLKLRENTIILLWGDHGWKLGEHGSWSKHTNFEIDTRSPLIVSAPHMKNANVKTNALVEFVDIYPTLADLCDLEIPAHIEGISFKPIIDNPEKPWKKAAFSQFPRKQHNVMGYAIRTKDFRYVEWKINGTNEVKAKELYDHRQNHDENVNVAGKPEYREQENKMVGILNNGWKACLPNK